MINSINQDERANDHHHTFILHVANYTLRDFAEQILIDRLFTGERAINALVWINSRFIYLASWIWDLDSRTQLTFGNTSSLSLDLYNLEFYTHSLFFTLDF